MTFPFPTFVPGVLVETLVDRTSGSAIGDMIENGGLAASFDGAPDPNATASKKTGTVGYVGKYWGSGVDKKMAYAVAYGASDDGFTGAGAASITITLQGSTDNFSSSVVDLGSSTFTDHQDGTGVTITATDRTTSYEYHRVKIEEAAGNIFCGELDFYELI